MKSHIVFGAGLIGCFLGGIFSWKQLPVQLVCRARIKETLIGGLTLTDYNNNRAKVDDLQFIDSDEVPSYTGSCSFLWVTVKCTGMEQAALDIAPLVGQDTVIFCCQNGLGSDKIIKQRYPNNLVLRVMVPFNVAQIKPGHLHRGSQGAMTLESTTQRQEVVSLLQNLLDSDLMPVDISTNMHALLWAKLQLNLGNSINALANIPVKNMLQQKHYRLVIAAMMDELLSVTKGLGIQLPKVTSLKATQIPTLLRLPNFLFKILANKMLAIDPTVRTSMWWDLSQGKNTEIDHLNGAIVEAANKLGIECPVNKAIITLIKQTQGKSITGQNSKSWEGIELMQESGLA